jgi:hypothetical protein
MLTQQRCHRLTPSRMQEEPAVLHCLFKFPPHPAKISEGGII